MALVQWTSRELLCTIRSHHTDANRIPVFDFFLSQYGLSSNNKRKSVYCILDFEFFK